MLQLSIQCYLKTGACIDNPGPAWICPNHDICMILGRVGITRPPTYLIVLNPQVATTSSEEINANLAWPLGTPCFPPRTHEYDPETGLLNDLENVWSPIKGHRPSCSMSIVIFKDHMTKFTLTNPKWMSLGKGNHPPSLQEWWNDLQPPIQKTVK